MVNLDYTTLEKDIKEEEELENSQELVPYEGEIPVAQNTQNNSGMLLAAQIYCYICGQVFRKPSGMIKHFSDEHPGCNPFACVICGKNFASHARWRSHQAVHVENKRLTQF